MAPKIGQTIDIESPKKMGGVGFYIMATFTIAKDFLDALEDLTIVLYIVSAISSIFMSIIIWMYYFFNDVGFIDKFATNKILTSKLGIFILSTIVELTPLNFLPLSTFSLFMIREMENHERFRKFVHTIAGMENPGDPKELFNLAVKNLSVPNNLRDEMSYFLENSTSGGSRETT